MQVSVEKSGTLERRMKVQLPAERVEQEVEKRLKGLMRRVKIKGFRPGKVPYKVVQQQYGGEVRSEVIQDLLRSSYIEALQQEKLAPAGSPRLEPVNAEPGKGLEYTATFEVYPEIEIKSLEKISIERPQATITEEDIDRMVASLRRQRASFETVTRPAAEGDRVTIDFEGSIKGESFPGGKGEKVGVVLGEGRMLEDFEKALQGVSAGEEKAFSLKFPKDYPSEDVAGKKAQFKVKVHEVAEQKLPALDRAFFEAFDVADEKELREALREHMQRELDDAVRRKLKEQALDGLLKANPLELPAALVDEEIERVKQETLQRMGMAQSKKTPDLPRELFEEQARRRVSLGLLLGELIKREGLKADPARITETIEDMAAGYKQPEEVVRAYRQNPQLMRQIEGMVLEEQAVDFLLTKAKVTEKPASFDEVVKPARQ